MSFYPSLRTHGHSCLPLGNPNAPASTSPRSLNIQLALDVEFVEAFAEGGAGDAKELGGVDLVALGFLQRVDDEFAFDGGKNLELGILPGPTEHHLGDGGHLGATGFAAACGRGGELRGGG